MDAWGAAAHLPPGRCVSRLQVQEQSSEKLLRPGSCRNWPACFGLQPSVLLEGEGLLWGAWPLPPACVRTRIQRCLFIERGKFSGDKGPNSSSRFFSISSSWGFRLFSEALSHLEPMFSHFGPFLNQNGDFSMSINDYRKWKRNFKKGENEGNVKSLEEIVLMGTNKDF